MSKFTPWAATTRQGSWDWVVYVRDNPRIEVCQLFHDGTEFNETGEANAHLIAAAPELYDALRDLLNTYAADINVPVNEITSGVGGKAKAALNKAKGNHPEVKDVR